MSPLNSKARGFLISVLFIAILIFGMTRLFPLISGPSLSLSGPSAIETPEGTVVIEGRIQRATELTIAGEQLIPDDEGYFSRELFVQEGHTIIEITASDRRGRNVTKYINVYSHGIQENKNTKSNESESSSGDGQGGAQ